jgi:uncharacterized protein (TIGR03437 family)
MRHHLPSHYRLAFALTVVSLLHAQPVIRPNSVVNAASHIFPGLPNYGLAQGSLFIVRGQGLASRTPQPFTSGNAPLQTTLAGASMQITVAGAKVDVPMVYAAVGMFGDYIGPYDELAGIVPSTTPAGDGTITVTFNGRTSAPASLTIVPSAFGIFSLNQSGVGPGVFTSPDLAVATLTAARNLIGPFPPALPFGGNSLIAAAHPGDQLVIWGTGLGPVAGDAPVELYVGGVQADVTSQARASCCDGVDQIQFTVPPGVAGCYVPVAVKIGAMVSNFVTASISTDGSVCSDPIGWSTSDLQNGAPKNVAEISLARIIGNFSVPGLGSAQGALDLARGAFRRYSGQPLGVLSFIGFAGSDGSDLPSAGCSVFPFKTDGNSTDGTFFDFILPGTGALQGVAQVTDAGPALNLVGPGGPMQIPENQNPDSGGVGRYQSNLGGGFPPFFSLPNPPYLAPGTYTLDNGSGGKDVGAFSATLTIPSNPVSWTGQDAITNIDRSQDLTVTWTGSGPVEITGSAENPAAGVGAQFACIAGDANSGTFTVPAWVLSSLPASGNAIDIPAPIGFLAVATGGVPARFQASGIDAGFFSWFAAQVKNLNYQ